MDSRGLTRRKEKRSEKRRELNDLEEVKAIKYSYRVHRDDLKDLHHKLFEFHHH
jgi:hypothetical protein